MYNQQLKPWKASNLPFPLHKTSLSDSTLLHFAGTNNFPQKWYKFNKVKIIEICLITTNQSLLSTVKLSDKFLVK
jgi:hypothetical protein